MQDQESCKACEHRASKGFNGLCPACANERALAELLAADERARMAALADDIANPNPKLCRGCYRMESLGENDRCARCNATAIQ